MKILVVGGGSGGHITPAMAVVREILGKRPRAQIEFWTDRKYYKNVVKITTEIGMRRGDEARTGSRARPYIRVRKIMAGKFHRYSGWGIKDYVINWQVTLKDLIWGNICGFVGFTGGLIQSFVRLVGREGRPDVVFLKGGFVGLPVGMVAKILKIPYVIHESDAVPGLANRLLMNKAEVVATGVEYSFREASESSRFVFTGTPVAPEFRPVNERQQKSLKKALGFDSDRPLVIVTGGSQGSQNINVAMREILPEMLKRTSVGLIAGRKHYEDMIDLKKYEKWDGAKLNSNFRMWSFCPNMDELMGAADIVISRAGATTIAELAALKKAVVLVPFERLPGGHQLKNAENMEKTEAVLVVKDADMQEQPGMLLTATMKLVRSPKLRVVLAENLHKIAKPNAAEKLAEIIINIAKGH